MSKSGKGKKNGVSPQSAHTIFQLLAVSLIIYIIYQAYSSDEDVAMGRKIGDGMLPSGANSAQVNQIVKQEVDKAIKGIYENPNFIKLKDFVKNVESNLTSKEPGILKVKSGYVLFIPDNLIRENGSKLKIKGYDKEINLESRKIEVDAVDSAQWFFDIIIFLYYGGVWNLFAVNNILDTCFESKILNNFAVFCFEFFIFYTELVKIRNKIEVLAFDRLL